ncbi:hypothetical protein EYF80_061978 [Liparis tanakae]|uniref:Uncharacterized protein n=1 Tax=Liparis tanakae TaxID=230148 RepID=A0A4Z2EGM1_9TELE|nr:hypothetical protein EYF80_061978 [Liparis tanakae]
MSKGGGQVPRAAPPAQRGASWVAGLVLIQRCGQRGGEVKAGQVRQRAAGTEPRRDAVRGRGRLLRRKDTKDRAGSDDIIGSEAAVQPVTSARPMHIRYQEAQVSLEFRAQVSLEFRAQVSLEFRAQVSLEFRAQVSLRLPSGPHRSFYISKDEQERKTFDLLKGSKRRGGRGG